MTARNRVTIEPDKHKWSARQPKAKPAEELCEPVEQFSMPLEFVNRLRKQIGACSYETVNEGKVRLATRLEIREKIGESPDFLDALIISRAFRD